MRQSLEVIIGHAPEDEAAASRISEALATAGLDLRVSHSPVTSGQLEGSEKEGGPGEGGYAVALVSGALEDVEAERWLESCLRRRVVPVTLWMPGGEPPGPLREQAHADFRGAFKQGQEELLQFFRQEVSPAMPPNAAGSRNLLRDISRNDLRLIALNCLDEVKFQSFLYNEEIHPNTLPGKSHQLQILALLWRVDLDGTREALLRFLDTECTACVKAQLSRRERRARA